MLARARRGDLAALETVYETFATAVHTLACRLCGSREEAEDVVQETFLEVTRSICRFRGDGAFGAWLRRIAMSKALTRLRHRRAAPDEDERAADLSSLAEQEPGSETPSTQRVDLERALARLPSSSRAVVWLHDVEGLSHREIAQLMGRSISFSKSQLARAHARLRLWLGCYRRNDDASEDRRAVGTARR